MLIAIEIVLIVASVILPLCPPKKKFNNIVDTNTNGSHYAIDEYGYIVKL